MDSTTLLCLVIPAVLIVLIMVVSGNAQAARQKALLEARTAYEKALNDLRERPTDPTRRQAALDAGRQYASLSRENKGTTIFDEAALKNDLDAATAGAVSLAAPPSPVSGAAPAASVADRLRQLDDLRQQGLITDDEYQARRKAILEGV